MVLVWAESSQHLNLIGVGSSQGRTSGLRWEGPFMSGLGSGSSAVGALPAGSVLDRNSFSLPSFFSTVCPVFL